MAVLEIFLSSFLLSFFLSSSDAAAGIVYPYLTNAMLGRGIDQKSGKVKGIILKDGYRERRLVFQVTKTVTKYTFVNDKSDVSDFLDVTGTIKFGINAGFTLSVDGKANYMRDTGNGKRDLQFVLSINILDYYEMVPNVESEGRPDCHKLGGDARNITHVVSGLLYGAQCFASVVWKSTSAKDRKNIMGELNFEFGKEGKFSIRGGAKLQFNHSRISSKYNYDTKVSCNLPLNASYPQTLEDIPRFAHLVPLLYEKNKNGYRGTPISMFLVPIDEIDSCNAIPVKAAPDVFSAPTVMESLFLEMEEMLKDFDAAVQVLDRCKKKYPMPLVGVMLVTKIQLAFYFTERAMNRRLIILKEDLADAHKKNVRWVNSADLVQFMNQFEQKYYDVVIMPSGSDELTRYITDVTQVGELREVQEDDAAERTPTTERQLIGDKIWQTRAELLCQERKRVSNIVRKEF